MDLPSTPSSTHVPFRNSELTKLLKSSLGGNSLTHIVITITPAEMQARESRMTIDFGTIAKNVENLPKQNETSSDKEVLLRRYEQQHRHGPNQQAHSTDR